MTNPNKTQNSSGNLPHLGVRILPTTKVKLKELAKREGRTTSDVVRRALRREIQRAGLDGEVRNVR